MSGPRSRRTLFDASDRAASAVASIWPAPGTVRSMRYLCIGISVPFVVQRAVLATPRTLWIRSGVVMRYSPHIGPSYDPCHGRFRSSALRPAGLDVARHRPRLRAAVRAHAAIGADR